MLAEVVLARLVAMALAAHQVMVALVFLIALRVLLLLTLVVVVVHKRHGVRHPVLVAQVVAVLDRTPRERQAQQTPVVVAVVAGRPLAATAAAVL